MVIGHLLLGVLTGIGAVLLGLFLGQDGWISLALYSTGGTVGVMASALLVLCRADLHDPWSTQK